MSHMQRRRSDTEFQGLAENVACAGICPMPETLWRAEALNTQKRRSVSTTSEFRRGRARAETYAAQFAPADQQQVLASVDDLEKDLLALKVQLDRPVHGQYCHSTLQHRPARKRLRHVAGPHHQGQFHSHPQGLLALLFLFLLPHLPVQGALSRSADSAAEDKGQRIAQSNKNAADRAGNLTHLFAFVIETRAKIQE